MISSRRQWEPVISSRRHWEPVISSRRRWEPLISSRRQWESVISSRRQWEPVITRRRQAVCRCVCEPHLVGGVCDWRQWILGTWHVQTSLILHCTPSRLVLAYGSGMVPYSCSWFLMVSEIFLIGSEMNPYGWWIFPYDSGIVPYGCLLVRYGLRMFPSDQEWFFTYGSVMVSLHMVIFLYGYRNSSLWFEDDCSRFTNVSFRFRKILVNGYDYVSV